MDPAHQKTKNDSFFSIFCNAMSAILTDSDKWADKVKMYSNRWCWSVTPFWPRLNNKIVLSVLSSFTNTELYFDLFWPPINLNQTVTFSNSHTVSVVRSEGWLKLTFKNSVQKRHSFAQINALHYFCITKVNKEIYFLNPTFVWTVSQ